MQLTVTHLDNEKGRRNFSYQSATIQKLGLLKYLASESFEKQEYMRTVY